MKKPVAFLAIFALLFCIAYAARVAMLEDYPPDIISAAMSAEIPEGLTDGEAEIYRLGFAAGYQDATIPTRGFPSEPVMHYVINKATKKFHDPECRNASNMALDKREDRETTRQQLIDEGFEPCKNCNP